MRFALAGAALLLNAMDNFTTFRCLTDPVSRHGVYEANPLASWAFDQIGLLPGLMVDTVLATLAVGFLLFSGAFDLRIRLGILVVMVGASGWAVVNNLGVMQTLGLALLG